MPPAIDLADQIVAAEVAEQQGDVVRTREHGAMKGDVISTQEWARQRANSPTLLRAPGAEVGMRMRPTGEQLCAMPELKGRVGRGPGIRCEGEARAFGLSVLGSDEGGRHGEHFIALGVPEQPTDEQAARLDVFRAPG